MKKTEIMNLLSNNEMYTRWCDWSVMRHVGTKKQLEKLVTENVLETSTRLYIEYDGTRKVVTCWRLKK